MILKRFKGFIIDKPMLYIESNMPNFFAGTWCVTFLSMFSKQLNNRYNELKALNSSLYDRIQYTPTVKKLETYFLKFFESGVDEVLLTDEGGSLALYTYDFHTKEKYTLPKSKYKASKGVVVTAKYTTEPSQNTKKRFLSLCKNNILIDKKITIRYVKV